jgi:serine/threonine-protein kinase
MSTVYLAWRQGDDRPVALKVLSEALAGNPTHVERFRREARSCLTTDHPNLVRGLAAGRDPATGRQFLCLEYVPGPTAHEWLADRGPLSVADAVHLAADLGRALEYLHRHNVIHRDVKPENVVLSPAGVARLLDLGLARRLDEAGDQLTSLDSRFGTPYYMPFEQALNAHFVDGRSDLFALGATIYHLLTGSVPFPGDDPAAITRLKERGEFTPARALNRRVPPILDALLSRLLAVDPRRRFQSASELLVALERTGLAAALPSWGSLDEALRDPVMRQRLTAPTAPTQLDLPPAHHTPPALPALSRTAPPTAAAVAPEAPWLLRVRTSGGGWRVRRASTEVVLRLARAGRLPIGVCAARPGKRRVWRPLRTYPEFRHLPPPGEARPLTPVPSLAPQPPGPRWLVAAGLFAVAAGVLALASAAALASDGRLFRLAACIWGGAS